MDRVETNNDQQWTMERLNNEERSSPFSPFPVFFLFPIYAPFL